jgi:hypothetical protein
MATSKSAGKSNGKTTPAKSSKPAKATKPASAAVAERVTLNVAVKATTRAGLAKLKLRLGLTNQGAVLDKLVRDGLAATKAR